MKSKSKSSRVFDRYGMIEALEPRIAPAAATSGLLANAKFVTATVGNSTVSGAGLLVKAGEVLTTGSGSGGIYLLYVEQGQVLVHTTDLNGNNQLDFNEITGLSVGNGARIVSFVDIHGDIVTDLLPDGSLDDSGKGDILLDANIAMIDMRSLAATDFSDTGAAAAADVSNHLALTSYSIFGNIYAGGGLGIASDTTSGLHIDTSGASLQGAKYTGYDSTDEYQASQAFIGSIYVGSSASGQNFSFGASGSSLDVTGSLLAFNPSPGEAGASIYNIGAANGANFNIGTLHAGNGGFNGPGGSIVNVALQGSTAGVTQLIAGNAGSGTSGQVGGSIINFSDTGAIMGALVLQSGNGGTGLTGSGGNGGAITFNASASVQVNAHVQLLYGSGGDGFTHGGNGGGTPSGTFLTPEGQLTTAVGLVTSMHTIGSIGSNVSFDFNGDGYSDAVFATTNPNQVVVALGDGASYSFGLDSNQYIYLNAPGEVTAISVGDFTGNGHPDIVVATSSPSFAGVEVFLSQYSASGVFEGFSSPLFTPLPSIPSAASIAKYGFDYEFTTTPITKIVTGDFAGNGVLGIAVLAQEIVASDKQVDSVLIFMNGETNATHPGGTGYFYSNFSNGNLPFEDLTIDNNNAFSPTKSIIEATALQTFSPGYGHDVVIEAKAGGKTFSVLDESSGSVEYRGIYTFDMVDTNRTAGGTNQTYVQFQVQGIAIVQDQTNPNIADIVALSTTPVAYLDTFIGDGNGLFTTGSGNKVDNAGISFGGDTSAPVAIVAVPNANTGIFSDVAILDYTTNNPGDDAIYQLHLNAGLSTETTTYTWFTITPENGKDTGTVVFGAYEPYPNFNPSIPGSGQIGFITADPLTNYKPDYQDFAISQPMDLGGYYTLAPFKNAGYFLKGGDGGNSASGAGGNGGSFGQSLTVTTTGTTTTATGTLSFEFPADITYEGVVNLVAGSGGNGFNAGGTGGNLSGISITYNNPSELTGTMLLFAGKGGESLTGTGGAGGSLSQLNINSGELFVAGNGGVGVIGGAGGSLFGNTNPALVTSQTNNIDPVVVLRAGDGASGIDGGGNGGGISSFVNLFNPIVDATGGLLNYTAGNAGNAVAGQAGTGGSITNSSPSSVDNNLAGDIYLQGGAGGSGLRGGNGGGVSNFNDASTIKDIVTSSTVLGGAGGSATIGTGGTGGGISGVSLSAAGNGDLYVFNFANPEILTSVFDSIQNENQITYNRMVAGAGGSSAGGMGGAGGAVNTITSSSVSPTSQDVVVAGAGGTGLTGGGAGGSVLNANVDAGAVSGKVIIIAGDGGASLGTKLASTSSPQAIALALGGVNGPGGAGGNITNFVQPLNTGTHVDLIAGNGGATVNHSLLAGNATADNSGAGGSITNILVAGSIGNSDPNVAIKSYNDILTGQTMQEWVDSYILGNPSAPIDDSVGNVGLVAGAAGSVQGGLPSTNGVNGSVSIISAENIMSMVAGNVDQVQVIRSLTDYSVTISGGVLGANKMAYYNPTTQMVEDIGVLNQLNYISADGALTDTPLPGGGELIDGAFVAANVRNPVSKRDF